MVVVSKVSSEGKLETDLAPTTEEYGIKKELVARSNTREFIPQTEPRLRENDEEAYE